MEFVLQWSETVSPFSKALSRNNLEMIIEKAYEEIVELLAAGTTSEALIAFRPSIRSQDRASYLLDRNRASQLSQDEQSELDRLGQLEQVMQLIKARARFHIDGRKA